MDDVDAICERAQSAGAEIIEEPADQEYGGRRFGAEDPEGHSWWFAQQIRQVASEDCGAVPASSSAESFVVAGGEALGPLEESGVWPNV